MANRKKVRHKYFKCGMCSVEFEDGIKLRCHVIECKIKMGMGIYG